MRDAITLAQDGQDDEFSRDHHTGGNHVQVPPPPVQHDPRCRRVGPGAAVRYLNTYITNNYVDDRDTIVDNSINQDIDNRGGTFDQDIDIDSVVASGDGAVAAGDDVSGTVTTGDRNQVGDDNVAGDGNVTGNNNNAVTGDDSTTSFGAGDVSSTDVGGNVTVGSGGAFSGSGDATVDNTDNSVSGSFNDQSRHSVDDSFNSQVDDSTHTSTDIDDSFNQTTDASQHTTATTSDSFNIDS